VGKAFATHHGVALPLSYIGKRIHDSTPNFRPKQLKIAIQDNLVYSRGSFNEKNNLNQHKEVPRV